MERRALRRWHARLGIAASVFVIVITVTGLLLQSSQMFGLDRVIVSNPQLLSHYGFVRDGAVQGLKVAERWIAWSDGALYTGAGLALPLTATPVGAVAAGEGIIVAEPGALHLLGRDGTLLERLDGHLLPGRVLAIGVAADGNPVLRTERGLFVSDPALLSFEALGETGVTWPTIETVPDAVFLGLADVDGRPGLPLDRIVLDLHTGRLFGGVGVFVVNAAGLLFLALGVSGVVMWLRARRQDEARMRVPSGRTSTTAT